MGGYGIYDVSRALTVALAAALAGLGLWGASQVGTQTPGRFWLAMAIVAAAGFVLAAAQHVGAWAKGLRLRLSWGTLAFAFLPGLVCAGWILLASQPGSGWEEERIVSWSRSLGILSGVHSIGLWSGVLSLACGFLLGLSLDSVPDSEPSEEANAPAPVAQPTAADGRWLAQGSRASRV